jgi:glutamine cyclotransferase
MIVLLSVLIPAANGLYAQKASNLKIKVLESYPHDTKAYTQGLFFLEGQMYESCGQYGESNFRIVDFKTGKVIKSIPIPERYFAEGAVQLGGQIFILTWQEKTVFVLDAKNLKNLKTFYNPRDGWGLTTDGTSLITSDGTSWIYYMNPANFSEKGKIQVKLNGKPLENINELEYINGEIWANVYQSDTIVRIDPKTGVVTAVIDCRNLLKPSEKNRDTDVLNGIAYNPITKSIYITGKNWPKLFKVEVVR